jgi:hypothetical protein
MEWYSIDSCLTATSFGWCLGAVTGLYAVASIIALLAFAAPFDWQVKRRRGAGKQRAHRAISIGAHIRRLRRRQWWAFNGVVFVPALLWVAGAWHVGLALLDCYVWSAGLGAFIPLAVVLALLMLGAARIVGSASAR